MSLPENSSLKANISPVNRHDSDHNVINEVNSSDSEYNPVNLREYNEIPTLTIRMWNLCKEFAIFCFIMATLSALTKDPPKVSKPPIAYPFFPQNSIVSDWYQGQISKAIEYSKSSDIAFIMYYAPWDAECQAARKEFEITAQYMKDYIHFAAVNCWQPLSECRTQYNKFYRWPILIAYPSHGRGIQYNGPINAPHMIQFLKKVCNPMLRLTNEKPRDFEDVYVVAEMNTSPGSLDFAVFYTACLNYLERDPQYHVTFYINPLPVPKPTLYLNLWNETLVFPIDDKNWTPDEILHWIFKSIHQTSTWVTPSGSKSLALSSSMENGPALILFTPKNPLYFVTDYYNMLQEITQEYFHCEENFIIDVHSLNIKLKRSVNLLQYKTLKNKCRIKSYESNRKVASHLKPIWGNVSTCSLRSVNKKDCNVIDKITDICSNLISKGYIDLSPVVIENLKNSCEQSKSLDYSGIHKASPRDKADLRSPESLAALARKEKCKQFVTAEKIQPAIFEKYSSLRNFNISGLSCKTNRSLVFLAMDSLLYYHFAERLGINVLKKDDKSAVAIINDKMESHYIMESHINGGTLREFVLNFTKNQLSRSLASQTNLNSVDTQHIVLKKKTQGDANVLVKELDTKTFLPIVLEDSKAVVVFYYSKQCAFCSGISYNFLLLAKKLSFAKNLVFTRIDGDLHLLPWEYTMESYPTILLFPATKKSESRIFPFGIPITVTNLIGFVLTNIEPSLKLDAMWSICRQTKFPEEIRNCYSSLLGEILAVINKILREWRKSNKRHQQVLLYKLKQLRQLHLLLAHAPHEYDSIENYFKKLNSKVSYSQDYHILQEDKHQGKDEL